MLLNEFYTIQKKNITASGFEATIVLNPSHFIYKAHFPQNPVTPGVCILQIAKELFSQHLEIDISMSFSKNVKFLQVLSPIDNPSSTFKFSWEKIGNQYDTNILVENTNAVFVKINAIYQPKK